VQFFLKIDGVLGDSADDKHKGEFGIDFYDLGISTDVAGQVVFSPLTVGLSSGLGSVLAQYAATQQEIGAVRLVGRTAGANPQEVYELRLNGVTISEADDSIGADRLSFDFERVALTTRVLDAAGSLVGQSFGFDLKTDAQIDPALVVAPGGGTVHGDVAQPVQFFLKIDGVLGDSADDKHKGEFGIDFYNFDVSTDAAGHAVFSPLSVELTSGLGSALVQYAATGQSIDALRLVGRTGGVNPQEVYELRLNGVTVSEAREGIFTDALSFDFERVALTTRVQNAGGGLDSQSFGFDLKTDAQIDPALVVAPGGGTVHGDVAEPVQFFLKIDGVLGDSADDKHLGEFDIGFYIFSVNTDAAGQVAFSPLSVDLASGLGSVLTQYAATQQEISAVRLVGRTAGASPQEIYELRLNGVTIAETFDGTFTDSLRFDYERLALTTKVQNAAGSLDTQSFGFDLKTNEQIDPALVVAPGGGTVHGDVAQPVQFFLKIDGVLGDSADDKHKGEFEVDLPSLVISTDAAGQVTFEPLRVDLEGGLGSVLTGYAATGQLIDAVRLVGRTGGANPQEVYELRLNGVTIDATFDSPASDLLSFDFERVALTTRTQDATGSLVGQSFGFDLKTNEQIDPALVVAPGAGTVHGDVPQAQQFFLKLDDFDGGSTDDKHKGEFEIDSYNFFISTDAAGQVVFSPLSVDLASGLGSALVQYAATQQPIDALRLVGRTGGVNPEEVYDLRLNGVTISEVRDGIQTDTLSFDFERFSITTKSLSPGGLLESHTFAYDVLNDQEIDPALVTSPHDAGGLFAAMGMSSPSFDDAMFAAFAGADPGTPVTASEPAGSGSTGDLVAWTGSLPHLSIDTLLTPPVDY